MAASISHPRANKLKRAVDAHSIANSSDTEDFLTPPRKRFRRASSVSESPSGSSCAGDNRTVHFDLHGVLQRCATDVHRTDYAAATELKNMPKGARESVYAVQKVLQQVKATVKKRADAEGKTLLETELYLEWLKGSQFAVDAIHNALNSKIPGTRKRIPGLGRPAFIILYHLIDEFICDVETHHDGWSYRSSSLEPSIYPPTLTLAEESNDPSTDARSDEAASQANELLNVYDAVMQAAICRYKVESTRSKKLACAIGRKEDSLAKACCLLCEQTGYGDSDDDDMGDKLLQHSRQTMRDWKAQYANEDEGLEDSDTDDL